MLADEADRLIGVDTHRDTHTAAVVEPATGVVGERTTTSADSLGYKRMLAFAERHAPGRRVWAIESTGSFGAGLTSYLLERGEQVVEVDRPKRPARRSGAKSDELDAIRAAQEALQRQHPTEPRRRGEREAIRVLQRTREGAMRSRSRAIGHLKALVVTAPEGLRSQLRRLADDELIARCARLRTAPQQSTEHRITVKALRATARRVLVLEAEANDLESELELLIRDSCPALLDERGVGTVSAAELLNAWSHRGRLRSEGSFAMLAGAAPRLLRPDGPPSAQPRRRPASSTGRCTRSSCRGSSTTPKPRPTPPAGWPRATPRRRSSAASSATSPGACSGCSSTAPPRVSVEPTRPIRRVPPSQAVRAPPSGSRPSRLGSNSATSET